MKTHYDINTVLYAIGMKQRWRRILFLFMKRHEIDEIDIEYGFGGNRIAKIISELSPLEKCIYGVKVKGGANDGN